MKKSLEVPAPTGPVVKVAFYCRVAVDCDDRPFQTQLDRLNSLLEDRRRQGQNWIATEKLVEGEKVGKSAYQKLLELARARLVDVVAVTRLDRLSRNPSELVKFIGELERYGVNLVSADEQIDLASPAGRFQTSLLRALAR